MSALLQSCDEARRASFLCYSSMTGARILRKRAQTCVIRDAIKKRVETWCGEMRRAQAEAT